MRKSLIFLFIFSILLSIHSFCANNSAMDRAVTLYKWKFYDDAIIELNRLLPGQEPYASRASFLKAHCLMKKGDLKNAEAIFRELSTDQGFPLYDYSKFYIAEICLMKNDYAGAAQAYKEIFPDSALRPEADMKRADCQVQLGDLDQAAAIYTKLIDENSSLTQMDKVRFSLGKCYEKMGKPKEAIKAYHELDLSDPLSPLIKEALARINHLSALHKIYPGAATAEDIFNKAQVYYNFGDFASAGMYFQKIVSNYRTSNLWEEALFKLSLCDYKRRKVTSAIRRFKICVDQNGDFADASQFYMAFAYGKAGYFYQCIDSLNKVIANYPNSRYAGEAAYYLGYFYEVNGFKDTAMDQYNRFVERYPVSDFIDDAYWKLGRLYYFKKDYQKAADLFKKAIESCKTGDWLDACSYWRALALEKMGSKFDSIAAYQYVVSRYDHTYYSYRAREKLAAMGLPDMGQYSEAVYAEDIGVINEGPFASTPLNEEPLPFEPGIEEKKVSLEAGIISKAYDIKEHFRKYTELMSIGFYAEAAKEAKVLIAASPSDKKVSAKLALATANLGAGQIKDSLLYAEAICNSAILYGTCGDLPRSAWHLAYPKGYYKAVTENAEKFGLDEFLVLAVIREESRFNPKTLSWANARGLMQIIPSTGLGVARLIGIRPYTSGRLYDADVNIKMGCYYLASLIKRFNGNKVLAVAAYNGGPLNVKKWMNKWNSELGAEVDMDEFVESIPLAETRRYVQKVMKSYYEYVRLYSTRYPKLSIKG